MKWTSSLSFCTIYRISLKDQNKYRYIDTKYILIWNTSGINYIYAMHYIWIWKKSFKRKTSLKFDLFVVSFRYLSFEQEKLYLHLVIKHTSMNGQNFHSIDLMNWGANQRRSSWYHRCTNKTNSSFSINFEKYK